MFSDVYCSVGKESFTFGVSEYRHLISYKKKTDCIKIKNNTKELDYTSLQQRQKMTTTIPTKAIHRGNDNNL